jgi:hypothetical protein
LVANAYWLPWVFDHDVGGRGCALAFAVLDYSGGLREAHRQAQRYRWVVWFFAAAALILAVSDSYFGSIRVALV